MVYISEVLLDSTEQRRRGKFLLDSLHQNFCLVSTELRCSLFVLEIPMMFQ